MHNEHYKFVNPPLPYPYDALEPFIDSKTMELHHDRHLQTYVDNLNNILKDYPQYQSLSLEQLLVYSYSLPTAIQTPIKNNAGGVFNHIFFFNNLKNPSTLQPESPLSAYITSTFGSYDNFQKEFTTAALSVFGSGYAWLAIDAFGQLKILTSANQDTPLTLNLCPILNLDVWEHAYYLKHYNQRAEYIKDWFHVINWQQVNHNLSSCLYSLHMPLYG